MEGGIGEFPASAPGVYNPACVEWLRRYVYHKKNFDVNDRLAQRTMEDPEDAQTHSIVPRGANKFDQFDYGARIAKWASEDHLQRPPEDITQSCVERTARVLQQAIDKRLGRSAESALAKPHVVTATHTTLDGKTEVRQMQIVTKTADPAKLAKVKHRKIPPVAGTDAPAALLADDDDAHWDGDLEQWKNIDRAINNFKNPNGRVISLKDRAGALVETEEEQRKLEEQALTRHLATRDALEQERRAAMEASKRLRIFEAEQKAKQESAEDERRREEILRTQQHAKQRERDERALERAVAEQRAAARQPDTLDRSDARQMARIEQEELEKARAEQRAAKRPRLAQRDVADEAQAGPTATNEIYDSSVFMAVNRPSGAPAQYGSNVDRMAVELGRMAGASGKSANTVEFVEGKKQ